MCCVLSHLSHVRLFCNPMDYSPPGSSVHGTLQARTTAISQRFQQANQYQHSLIPSFFQVPQLSLQIYYLFFFNCRIIVLQYCVSFCHISTRISHRCIYVPSHLFFIGKEVYLTGNHSTPYCPFNDNSLKFRSKCFLQGKVPRVITLMGMFNKGQV